MQVSETDVLKLAYRLREIANVAHSVFAIDDRILFTVIADEMVKLVHDRDIYQARCLAAAKQCDELATQLEALRARRQKANDK